MRSLLSTDQLSRPLPLITPQNKNWRAHLEAFVKHRVRFELRDLDQFPHLESQVNQLINGWGTHAKYASKTRSQTTVEFCPAETADRLLV